MTTNNVSDTGNLYQNVTFRLDPRVWKIVKREAINCDVTLTSIVSEAVIAWIKWLKKAELEEVAEERAEKTRKELREAEELLNLLVWERKVRKIRKTKKPPTPSAMDLRYPASTKRDRKIARIEKKEKLEREWMKGMDE